MSQSIAEQRAAEAGGDGTKFSEAIEAILDASPRYVHRYADNHACTTVWEYLDGSAIGEINGCWDVLHPCRQCWVGQRCQCEVES